jgi:hypothetical protein
MADRRESEILGIHLVEISIQDSFNAKLDACC